MIDRKKKKLIYICKNCGTFIWTPKTAGGKNICPNCQGEQFTQAEVAERAIVTK